MEVRNMTSAKGNTIANQFIIDDMTTDNCGNIGHLRRAFQSYDSLIAVENLNGQIYLDEKYWDYSVTTGRYRNMFLGESKKETLKKIKSGEYKLVNLN